jgi:hypothetical protein
MEHTNTLCGQGAEFWYVQKVVHVVYNWALNDELSSFLIMLGLLRRVTDVKM